MFFRFFKMDDELLRIPLPQLPKPGTPRKLGYIGTDDAAVISFIAVRACPVGTASSYRGHMPNDPEYGMILLSVVQ
jgi:hypothetical protein